MEMIPLPPELLERMVDEHAKRVGVRRGWRAWVPSLMALKRGWVLLLFVALVAALDWSWSLGPTCALLAYFTLLNDDRARERMVLLSEANDGWNNALSMVGEMKQLVDMLRRRKTHPLEGANNVVIFDSRPGGHDA